MSKPTLTLSKGYILVEFEEKPKLSEALDLVAPERFLVQEADSPGETNAWAVTTDRRTINPQIVNVIVGDDDVPTGSRCFVHYGAFEVAKWFTPKQAIIKSSLAFFMLDPVRPFPGNYLGEQIILEGERTESGIYLTPNPDEKLPCHIRITHIPIPEKTKCYTFHNGERVDFEAQIPNKNSIEIGDEVITIDASQYTLKFEDKTYVRMKDSEIIAKVVDGEVIPRDKYIVAEYVETVNKELIAENKYKAHMKDVSLKHRLFVPGVDFEAKAPSKNVDARLVAFGPNILERDGVQIGDMAHINRHRGLKLAEGKWMINLDTILFVYEEK